MTRQKIYRLADLTPGDQFYIETYPYDVLTLSAYSTGGNVWHGNRKIYITQNIPVDPVDRRKAARNRLAMIRKASKAHGITPQDLRAAYQTAVFRQSEGTLDKPRRHNAEVVESLPQEIRAALDDLGLIAHAPTRDGRDVLPFIVGRFFGLFI